MRLRPQNRSSGIALIIVMVVILALTIMVGGFVYSMKVEIKLARNNNVQAELEWLGRSGVEFAKYLRALGDANNAEPYDSLNQKWAGGPGSTLTNAAMEEFSLTGNQLGAGTFSVKIVDLERKMNINFAPPAMLQQAMTMMGVDARLSPMVTDSIADWIDADEAKHLSGAESVFYLAQKPAYHSKNGPIDDLSELLLIQGVTPAMYWGPRAASHRNQGQMSRDPALAGLEEPGYPVGLVDLFTAVSSRFININTAPAEVFQLVPGVDPNRARAIIQTRSGPDGADGTSDDVPFKNLGEMFANVPGMQGMAQSLGNNNVFSTRSATFEVTVTAEIGGVTRDFFAIIRRSGQKDYQTLAFFWR